MAVCIPVTGRGVYLSWQPAVHKVRQADKSHVESVESKEQTNTSMCDDWCDQKVGRLYQ